MSFQSLVRPLDWRSVRWPVWALLALALAYLGYRLTQPPFALIDVLVGCAPLVFAAAVLQVAPSDRHFTWGAYAIAAGPTVRLAAALIPGEWLASAPALLAVSSIGLDVARVLLFLGLTLIGLAVGGVRSAFALVVVGAGLVVGFAEVAWVLSQTTANLAPLDVGKSIAFALLAAVAWAFLVAAAIDALRSLLIVGAGLLFVVVAIDAALLWWPYGPDTNFGLVALAVSSISLAGWAAMVAAVLRGELNPLETSRSARLRARRNRS